MKPKPWWLGAIFVAAGLVILIGLGTWQLQRLKWKEGLLAHIAALHAASPIPLEDVTNRDADSLDFTRVDLDCPLLERSPTLRLYALEDGEAGWRIITACPVPGGSVLVDRGYLPESQPLAAGRERLTERVVGVLRQPSGANLFTPKNDPAAGRWFWRDIPAMARALGAERPLPATLMLESPAPDGGAAPRPAPLPTDIPNRHLEYALTWYGLAAALAGVYIALLLRRRSSKT